MIQLRSDCLVFRTPNGERIPCSAEQVTVELTAGASALLDPEVVRNAVTAVLHYFKHELGQCEVSMEEFSEALKRALRGFGIAVQAPQCLPLSSIIVESDLRELAFQSGKGFELAFFQRLRDELRHKLSGSPRFVHFTGLRGCVKQLAGAQRWSERCQRLSDHIVDYLRQCFNAEKGLSACALVVN